MENNSNKKRKLGETVTLVLKEKQFVVEKQKLMDKSQYFAALWSANFIEHGQTEHVINYDISWISLQDFIDWIHNDKITFTSATSYDFKELDRLLILLKLSVLFTADKLKEDITDRLERRFMSPKYAIDIWLLAQELNINVLRDLSLAVCLDRFLELPHNSIYELSEKHFLKLIGNVNVRATKSHLLDITQKWIDYHQSFTAPFDIIVLKKKAILDILKNKEAKFLQGIISCEHNNRKQFIHCWDGNDFFELTSFEYPPDIIEHSSSTGKPLVGMQIIARRYDLYLCGGEYGIGSGIFNKNIWRYSLISKKWILETVMPVERRHMITVFLKDKLYLVGGVGHIQELLTTVDIYDIYTGKWTSGAKIPNCPYSFLNDLSSDPYTHFDGLSIIWRFKWSTERSLGVGVPIVVTSSSEHFIFKDTLIICKWKAFCTFIYCPDKDVWKKICLRDICELQYIPTNMPILALQTMSCYIDVVDQDKMVLKVVTDTCNVKGCNNIIKTFSKSIHKEKKRNMDGSFFLTPFCGSFHDERLTALLYEDHIIRNKTLHLHSISIQDPKKFRSLCFTSKNSIKGFFNLNLLHPAHLDTTMNLGHI